MSTSHIPAIRLRLTTGAPLFAEPLHVSRPLTAPRQAFDAAIDDIFDRAWLTNDGPYVQELEAAIASRHGVGHAVALANGTLALQILLTAHDLQGEVILPSFTFIATAHAVRLAGLEPVFADIDARTLTLDPDAVEALITPRTSAILPVHLFGQPADTARLEALAARHGLRVIYDAAHGFAAAGGPPPLGSNGAGECLSFHATKIFNTFEGGAVLTNDDAVAGRCRLLRNFGFTGYDEVAAVGTNAKMNEISAAHGLALLPAIDVAIAAATRAQDTYARLLPEVPGLSLLVDPAARAGFGSQSLPVAVEERVFGLSRDLTRDLLWHENVLARRYFHPGCHRMAPYLAARRGPMSVTEQVSDVVLCLPAGPHVSVEDAEKIVGLLATAHQQADDVRSRTWASNQAAHE